MDIYGIKVGSEFFVGIGRKSDLQGVISAEYGSNVKAEFVKDLDTFAKGRILKWYERNESRLGEEAFIFPYSRIQDLWQIKD